MPPIPDKLPVYTGIFTREPAQRLLYRSLAQMQETLGAAWRACCDKEDCVGVFGRCMDSVETWNDRVFQQEAETCFVAQDAGIDDCLRTCFLSFVDEMRPEHPSSAMQGKRVEVSVPAPWVFVQALLTIAARHPQVRSGALFTTDWSLERKDIAMDIVRDALRTLHDEYVSYVEEEREEEDEDDDAAASRCDEVLPEDSASNVGVQRHSASRSEVTTTKSVSIRSGQN